MFRFFRSSLCLAVVALMSLPVGAADDPYLWLEDIDGDQAIEWVKKHNSLSKAALEAVPEFATIYERNLEVLNSDARIPSVTIRAGYSYNLWQDAKNPRGLWRRTSLEEYQKEKPEWELVLDVDALGKAEGESWVWKGASCLAPEYKHCMIALSRGGGDAVVSREFDTVKKDFVEGGFFLPEAKSNVSWMDENTLWVGTDFGPGSLTDSGYPRLAKRWRRGTPLDAAVTVFEGATGDVAVAINSDHRPEGRYDIAYSVPEFYRGEQFLLLDDRLVKLDLPIDVSLKGFFKDQLLISLRSPWSVGGNTYPQDALLAIDLDAFLAGSRAFELLFEPKERVSLDSVSSTRDRLLVTTLDNVRGRLFTLRFEAGDWIRETVKLPGLGQAELEASSKAADIFLFSYSDFLTPSSLWLVKGGGEPKKIKSLPAFFDAGGMEVAQYEAISADGTPVPYFVILPPGFEIDRNTPTMLYGYGGFEVSMTPFYSGTWGTSWMERGGVAVLANIRGGGEFGPRWHQAALKADRDRAFEDFIAVGEDLVRRKITSVENLGIMGGSNGGLLVGAAFTLRPDLFKAVVCQAPLLDMKRYHHLLAGASWMAEYGDPDNPEEWEFIKTWSPYHLVDEDATYPEVLFTTSTRDDRVHPGHARKMVALMEQQGHPVLLYENIEGGHAGAADNSQRAYVKALEMAYLWKMLR